VPRGKGFAQSGMKLGCWRARFCAYGDAFPPHPLPCTALGYQEFPSSLGFYAMSLAVKRPLTVPGTPVAWPRWGTKAGIISHPLTAPQVDQYQHYWNFGNSSNCRPRLWPGWKFTDA